MDTPNADVEKDILWKKIVSTAAHEIRTPLSSLQTPIEILRMNRLDAEQAGKLMTMMNRQIEAISDQLDTLVNRPGTYLQSPPPPHE